MRQASKFYGVTPQRIVILRALQLGDLMCAVPAFRALRSALPHADITLIGLPWARAFVQRFDYYLDDFIEFPGFPGFPEQPVQIQRLPQFLSEVQWLNFDLSIQMQGSGGISNPLIEMLGARISAGFYLPGQYCPDEDHFVEYPVHESEVRRHLHLMEFLGFPAEGEDLEYPLYPQDWEEYRALEEQYSLQPCNYVCIHPGARSDDRRWPAERFAAVADKLAERGLQVVLTGTEQESHLTAAVAAQMNSPAIDLAGKTSLGSIGALLSEARLLVSNDTGVSHIAAALCTPSVVLYSASDPNRWAPKNRKLHRIIAWASAAQPQLVLSEAQALLQEEHSYAI